MMNDDNPMVSVVIPFYSQKNWLIDALDSVIKQDYPNKEIIVINDGSKEDISDIISKYDTKVKFVWKENGGPATARNLGIKMATGKYIAFLDSDDIWIEGKLKKQVDCMEKNNAIWSQHSYEIFWDGTNKTKTINTSVYKGNVYKDCFISFKIQTSCVMVRKENIIKDEIIFPTNKRYGQDCAFYKELAKRYDLYSIDSVYSKFRIRGTNAGFRAIVQINDRASTWSEIKNDKEITSQLPHIVRLAYKICKIESKFISKFNIKNETIAKVLYVIPWLMFRIYAK